MSGGISAATIFGAIGAAAAVYGAVSQKKPSAAAAPTAPEAPPAASKTPDVMAMRRQNAAAESGPGMGSGATLLTGPSGVDTSLLSLGKATLLGQ